MDACDFRPRPIRVRKVSTLGTKGIGEGTAGGALFVLFACRVALVESALRAGVAIGLVSGTLEHGRNSSPRAG